MTAGRNFDTNVGRKSTNLFKKRYSGEGSRSVLEICIMRGILRQNLPGDSPGGSGHRQKAHCERIHEEYERHYFDPTSMAFRERFIYDIMYRNLNLDGKTVADPACGSRFIPRAVDFLDITSGFRNKICKLLRKPDDDQCNSKVLIKRAS